MKAQDKASTQSQTSISVQAPQAKQAVITPWDEAPERTVSRALGEGRDVSPAQIAAAFTSQYSSSKSAGELLLGR